MFKEKTSKKRIHVSEDGKKLFTLDVMHGKMINNIEENIQVIKEQEKMYNSLMIAQKQIENIIAKSNTSDDNYNEIWSSNIFLKEEIQTLDGSIKNNKKKYDEMEYYTNTSDILFNYYELIDKQSKSNKKHSKPIVKQTNKTILDALNNISKCDNIEKQNDDIIHESKTKDKSDLVDEYLTITNKNHIKKIDNSGLELCKRCNEQMTCFQHDAIIICEKCGFQELLLVEQNRPILKQNVKDTSHFSYKRINHFREWCNQVQGKESTDIPNEVFEKILNEIKKEKISNTKNITYSKMREILKRLRINKYYEHINYIINRINGIPTPNFSPELEEKLFLMFRDIQGPFLRHCPKDRKNFLSYSYVLYKFFQILGFNEYLRYFPLLKSREKLYVQDQIWKKICEDLKYEFHPSPLL
jgi:hypothetical protein